MTEVKIQDHKRRKYNEKTAKPNQCEFFLVRKNRQCSMQRKANQKYCSEHLIHDAELDVAKKGERVPCPLDPKHTVWSKDVASHVKKCNSKPKDNHDAWFEEDINMVLQPVREEDINTLQSASQKTERVSEEDTTVLQSASQKTELVGEYCDNDSKLNEEELLSKYITVLRNATQDYKPLKLESSQHEGLDARLAELTNKKHAIQQSSLVGNLRDRGLLSGNYFYVEFGCGKGELSRTLNQCILADAASSATPTQRASEASSTYGFGLIDRGVNRMKSDSKIVKDVEESNTNVSKPVIRRSRIDIKDLSLDKFVLDLNPTGVVGISKHLCGAATDLTLKSIFNSTLISDNIDKFSGVQIAMCCRHVCEYNQLLPQSQQYLSERGFKTEAAFNVLKKMVSWAVCGSREHSDDSKEVEHEEIQQQHSSGLSVTEREELGLHGRRLVDESRAYAVNEILGSKGYRAELFLYTEKQVTLENSCLCIRPIKPEV